MSTRDSTPGSVVRRSNLPVGVSHFGKLIRGNYTFVDKSLLIREFIDDGSEVNLITRPRRFGKTLNLSMLHHFFAAAVYRQPTSGLFDGLAISNDAASMTHQGQYPVIFFTFKDIKESQFDDAAAKLADALKDLFEQFPELTGSDALSVTQKMDIQAILERRASLSQLSSAFKRLSEFLYLHYRKNVLLLIDEYDTPIHAAYVNGYYEEMIKLMRGLLGGGLKDNPHLHKAVVTGILRVAKESLFSGVNNLSMRTVLDQRYGCHFGFTEQEVAGLFTDNGGGRAAQVPEPVKTWYNGYRFGETTIYNPWSIVSYLNEEQTCRPYWVNTSDNALLKQLMARADGRFKQQMEQLIQEQSVEQLIDPNIVFADLDKSTMALWSLLLFSGYLTSADHHYDIQGRAECRLSIPNLEVLGLYQRHIEEWFSDSMGVEEYGDFLRCLITGELDEFEQRLKEYLEESASYFDTSGRHPEKFYHGMVLGLIAGLKETHFIYSNRESGYGRYDIAIIPRGGSRKGLPGILMEFKRAKSSNHLDKQAESALAQIDRLWYQAELEQHKTDRIIKIGLAFAGKRVAMAYTDG